MEPRPHWWEVSALTTTRSLLPYQVLPRRGLISRLLAQNVGCATRKKNQSITSFVNIRFWLRESINVDTMVLEKQFIGVCAENVACSVMTNGMSMFLEKVKSLRQLKSFDIFAYNRLIEYNKPNPLVVDKHQAACHIIDKAIQGDVRVEVKEKEKIDKFQDQAKDVRKLWSGLELLWRRLGQFQKDRWAILKVLG